MGIKGMWKDLRTSPVDTLVRWQEQRLLWLLMAVAMGALIILAHSFFQIYLYMVMPNPSQIRSIVSTDNCPPRRSLFFRVE